MKKLSKLTAQAAVAVSLLSVAAPTFTSAVQASSVEPPVKKPGLTLGMNPNNKTSEEQKVDNLYSDLPQEKKAEFNALTANSSLKTKDKLDLLQAYFTENKSNHTSTSQSKYAPKWKTAVVKKVVKALLKVAGHFIDKKGAAAVSDYLFGWEGNMEKEISNALVYRCHLDRNTANWIAKTVMFIAF